MSGRIHSIETFGTVDGPGTRFVVFVQGCPMRCAYCHNPDTWPVNGGTEMEVSEIMAQYERNKAFYNGGGITVTGGEPLLQVDFLIELFTEAKKQDVHTCIDTSGITYKPENTEYIAKLDELIRAKIPCGREVRTEPHGLNGQIDLTRLRCSPYVNLHRAQHSIGTLGGGNHFIEVDRGENGELFLVVHSGSRHIGNEVAKYYQDEGRMALWGGARHQVDAAVAQLKAEGRFSEIQSTVRRLRKEHAVAMPKDLAYVEGRLFEDYIHDMKLIKHFAALNRKAMTDVILSGMALTPVEQFTTVHNYIDTDNMVLRKGAVAAYAGQKLLIPINMRDGSLICMGKGNAQWNCSAPHGAGRLMSRTEAFRRLSLEEYRKEMEGIFTTCVDRTTLDEAPMAYKGIDEIVSHIGPTVEIVQRIIPVYNFKAAE